MKYFKMHRKATCMRDVHIQGIMRYVTLCVCVCVCVCYTLPEVVGGLEEVVMVDSLADSALLLTDGSGDSSGTNKEIYIYIYNQHCTV